MSEHEKRVTPPAQAEQPFKQLEDVFNMDAVAVDVSDEGGWNCHFDDSRGLVITMDTSGWKDETGQVDEDALLFIGRNKLQQVHDILKPEYKEVSKTHATSESDKLFYETIDNLVYDARTMRTYNGYHATARRVYDEVLPVDDIKQSPAHVSFIKGLQHGAVFGNDAISELDADIKNLIQSVQYSGDFNIIDALVDHSTSLQQRQEIADRFLKPYFDHLVELNDGDAEGSSRQAREQSSTTKSANSDNAAKQDQSDPSDGDNGTSDDAFKQSIEDAISEMNENSSSNEPDHTDNSDANNEPDESSDPNNSSESEDSSKAPQADPDGLSARDVIPSEPSRSGMERITELVRVIKAAVRRDGRAMPFPDDESDPKDLQAQLAGRFRTELNLSRGNAKEYARTLVVYQDEIRRTADAFLELSVPYSVPGRLKMNNKAVVYGSQLHQGRLALASMQSSTDQELPVYRGRERTKPRQEFEFGGITIRLIVDASKSMNGVPAQKASQMGVILMEGLLLAKARKAREVANEDPDVEVGAMIFAGDAVEIIKPTKEPSASERADMFVNVRKADQYNTLVCPALNIFINDARLRPDRQHLAYIVSDNEFGDNPAWHHVPDNAMICNFSTTSKNSMMNYGVHFTPNAQPDHIPLLVSQYIKNFMEEKYGN